MIIGDKLKKLRKTNDLSQEQMADKLCMTQGNYSMYENSQRTPTIDLIQRIVDEFDVDMNWLLDNHENKVVFESGSTNTGAGIIKAENYYAVPKEMFEKFIEIMDSFKAIIKEK